MRILDDSEIEKTFVERDPILPELPSSRPASTAAHPLIGQTRIGFGLVVDTIGIGGMASVYKVWNERLELFRAVKMLSLDTLHARFETEAKITAKLRHPHIVEVYSVGEWNGVPYMEMEYVDGVNLQEALDARGRFPDAVCCAAGLCIASALNYAHTLKFTLGGNSYDGIIHRDLKPANVLLSKHSEIKLTDFGIARPAQAGLHTIDGNIVGTLHYLSPEQLGGGKIDRRSDIYSFGTILYEMATGTKTFPQKNITELTMRRAANSFKSPDEFDAPVAKTISNIILKCLKAAPDERYNRTAELIRDLQKAYAEIAPKCVPQKTLYDFFSVKDTTDTGITGITPTVLISVDVDDTVDNDDNTIDTVNPIATNNVSTDTDIDTNKIVDTNVDLVIDTNINTVDSVDTTVNTHIDTNINTTKKSPRYKKNAVYAAAIPILILLISYLTVKLISPPRQKADNNQSLVTTNSFSAPADTDSVAAKTVNAADIDTPDINTPNINTVSIDTNIVNINTVKSVNTNTPKPAPPTEGALIKDASEAVAKKEWDNAIRILEKNKAAFIERRGERHLLLLEAYVESRQLDKARTVLDSAAKTDDALYFLIAGRYYFYRNDLAGALAALEASLTRSSAIRNRNAVLRDALYYIALIRSDRFKTAPTEITRKLAQDAWRRVKSAYESQPESQRFKRAETEILELY